MSKGSTRRPRQVSRKAYEENWNHVFKGKIDEAASKKSKDRETTGTTKKARV
jgi:hypothetical protein